MYNEWHKGSLENRASCESGFKSLNRKAAQVCRTKNGVRRGALRADLASAEMQRTEIFPTRGDTTIELQRSVTLDWTTATRCYATL